MLPLQILIILLFDWLKAFERFDSNTLKHTWVCKAFCCNFRKIWAYLDMSIHIQLKSFISISSFLQRLFAWINSNWSSNSFRNTLDQRHLIFDRLRVFGLELENKNFPISRAWIGNYSPTSILILNHFHRKII